MRILLIGHKGYIGSGLQAAFERKHHVTGWGRQEDLFKLDAETLRRLNIDVVVNCAVEMDRQGSRYELDTPSDTVNVKGARHLAKILKGSKIPWFQISTKDVFGPVYNSSNTKETETGYRPAVEVGEDQPFQPQTVYSKSKLIAEFISEDHACSNVIRLSSCYSDFDHYRGNWMTHFIRCAITGQPIRVTHNGKQFRDPLHTEDLAALIVVMVEKGLTGYKLNAGGGAGNVMSLLEFIHLLDPNLSIQTDPGDDYGFAFSNERAQSITGWKPTIFVKDRIAVIKDHVSQNLSKA